VNIHGFYLLFHGIDFVGEIYTDVTWLYY